MTAATTQSVRVSGLIANPQTIIPRAQHAAPVLNISVGYTVATTEIDEIGDIILVTELPWQATLRSIRLVNTDMDTNGTPTAAMDVGLYKMTKAGTVTVLDADAYASAITAFQASNVATGGVEVLFESGVKLLTLAGTQKKVFEDAGLTAEPQDGYVVLGLTMTAAAATAAVGTFRIDVEYTM